MEPFGDSAETVTFFYLVVGDTSMCVRAIQSGLVEQLDLSPSIVDERISLVGKNGFFPVDIRPCQFDGKAECVGFFSPRDDIPCVLRIESSQFVDGHS